LEDPDTDRRANTLNSLAGTLIRSGRIEEAIPYQQRAIEAWRTTKPLDVHELARSVSNLANACTLLSRYAEACRASEEAVALLDRADRPSREACAGAAFNRAQALYGLGDELGAEAFLEARLERLAREPDGGGAAYALMAAMLGKLLMTDDRPDEA